MRKELATPTSYDEAIAGPQKRQWEVAIADELRSMLNEEELRDAALLVYARNDR